MKHESVKYTGIIVIVILSITVGPVINGAIFPFFEPDRTQYEIQPTGTPISDQQKIGENKKIVFMEDMHPDVYGFVTESFESDTFLHANGNKYIDNSTLHKYEVLDGADYIQVDGKYYPFNVEKDSGLKAEGVSLGGLLSFFPIMIIFQVMHSVFLNILSQRKNSEKKYLIRNDVISSLIISLIYVSVLFAIHVFV